MSFDKRKIRVLQVYRTYFPDTQGGLEETIRQICLNTSSTVDSRVFTLSPNPQSEIVALPEADVVQTKRHLEIASCSISFSAMEEFRAQCDWADIIHYHFPWPFADLLHILSRSQKPTILTYHSDIVRQRFLSLLYQPLQDKFLGSVDQIICTSPNYFATSDVLLAFENKVDVIPIGISEESYPKPSADAMQYVQENYGEDFFLFVGVLRYYKGLHILLDAIKQAEYKVVIAGSGPTELELMAQAKKEGISNVEFAGYVTNDLRAALYTNCRATVFPSYLRAEAFGVTLLEGAMYGKALISTEVGSGTSHINVDKETGFVVTPGSAKSIRQALDQLYYRPDLAEMFGKQARRRYEKLFTGAVMGERYVASYKQLLGKEAAELAFKPEVDDAVGS